MIHTQDKIGFAVRCAFAVLALARAGGKLICAECVFGTETAGADAVSAA